MSGVITKKSGYLETEAQHRYGEVENSNEVAGFVRHGGSSRNRNSIAYFGFKGWLVGSPYKQQSLNKKSGYL